MPGSGGPGKESAEGGRATKTDGNIKPKAAAVVPAATAPAAAATPAADE